MYRQVHRRNARKTKFKPSTPEGGAEFCAKHILWPQKNRSYQNPLALFTKLIVKLLRLQMFRPCAYQ